MRFKFTSFILVMMFIVVGNVNAQVTVDHDFFPGWTMMTIPVTPNDNTVAAIIDSNVVGPWDLVAFNYNQSFHRPDTMVAGQGYWFAISYDSTCNIELTGFPPADSVFIDLDLSWNLIGTQTPVGSALGNAMFRRYGEFYDIMETIAEGYIIPVLYGFEVVRDSSWWRDGYYEDVVFEPWMGYWFRTLVPDLEMIFIPPWFAPPQPSPGLPGQTPVAGIQDDWEVTVMAEFGTSRDRQTSFGAHQDASELFNLAFDFPEPPNAPVNDNITRNQIKAFFRMPNPPQGWDNEFNHDIRGTMDDEVDEWTLHVVTNDPGEVNLSWVDIVETVPEGYEFLLIDGDETVNMLEDEGYTFEIGEDRYDITFRVTANEYVSVENIVQPVQYSLLSAYPNPFNSTSTISYFVPKSSDVKINVFDLAGRMVSTVVNGNHQAGNFTTSWNARDLKSGVYLIKLETPEANAVSKVMLVK